MIKLYTANVACLADDRLFESAYSLVSDERRRKTDKYKYPKDKYLSLGVGLLLYRALGELGIDRDMIEFEYGERQKPYIRGRDDVFFNLSHSGEYALCAVADTEVGCDIEMIADADLAVAKRFFTENEYKSIISQPTDDIRREMFYRYWTLKESYVKATGLGIGCPMNSFEINIGESITVNSRLSDGEYFLCEPDVTPGYRAAVCAVGGERNISTFEVDLRNI